MSARNQAILQAVVSLPTAPFVERAVVEYVRRFVARRAGLSLRADRFGNLLVRYRGPRRGKARGARRPLVLAAHLDHPGFVARGMTARDDVIAEWRGWVNREYFRDGRVRFFTNGQEIPGRIIAIDRDAPEAPAAKRRGADSAARAFGASDPPTYVTIRTGRPVPAGAPGMWDLPAWRVVGHRFHARACDDLAGAAAILCALDALCRTRAAGECQAFFTRAEEVGFAGALAAVAERGLPRRAVVVAVECSKAVAGVALGGGPVLRVGDKASVFTPEATAWCQQAAERLAADDPTFRFQRKLMDGGTCESTVYCHYGYDATGLCLPLLNYHNMDVEKRRIAPEAVDLRDFDNLVKWFVALATSRGYDSAQPALDRRLRALLHKHRPQLLRTA